MYIIIEDNEIGVLLLQCIFSFFLYRLCDSSFIYSYKSVLHLYFGNFMHLNMGPMDPTDNKVKLQQGYKNHK